MTDKITDLADTIYVQLYPEFDDAGHAYLPYKESIETISRLISDAFNLETAATRLVDAMEGELDGLTTDIETAKKIMTYVLTGEPA